MNTVCDRGKCVGCMACVEKCPKSAIAIYDSLTAYDAVIDENACINCGICYRVCQINNPLNLKETRTWLQGWINNQNLRERSSSGGAATALLRQFVTQGGIVCSCKFENGKFDFGFVDNIEHLEVFAGSKYVKSNPLGVYKSIHGYLKAGKDVLFLGLPCQVAAVKNYIGSSYDSQLMLVEVICHGTPSPNVLESFLADHDLSLRKLNSIQFRCKDNFHISSNTENLIPISSKGIQDLYSYAFLNSTTYTDNCYSCVYAQEKRVADISLGDSWGSELSAEEKKKGISLILCQTEKGERLVRAADLHLEPVDRERSIKANRQLKVPSKAPAERAAFFKTLKEKSSFEKAILKAYPKKYVKYKLKELLIRFNLWGGGKNLTR